MEILHIVTLNSKLLHFGQELHFDRGGSFDELINCGPFGFNSDILLVQNRGKPPLYCLHFPLFCERKLKKKTDSDKQVFSQIVLF